MKTTVTIIGAGKIGQAIAAILKKKPDVEIALWDTDLTKVQNQQPLEKIIPTADIIFTCTPLAATRAVLVAIKNYLPKKAIIVSPCKGVEQETGLRIDEVIVDVVPGQCYALLLGSMLADEMMSGQPGVAALACSDETATRLIKELFSGTLLYLKPTADIVGAAYAGILKNIYAILFGVIHGLNYGDNAKGFIAAKIISEMQMLICLLGGHEDTCLSAPGAGDFLTTGYSPLSRNRQVGEAIITGKPYPQTSEGLLALPMIVKKMGAKMSKYPILTATNAIVLEHADPRTIIENLLDL